MSKKPDRSEELKDLMMRMGATDMRVQEVIRKAWSFSPEELDALLVMPESTYPIKQNGIEFKNKAQVRICRYAHMSKKEWPAGLQASHERAALFTKYALTREEKKVKRLGSLTVTQNILVVPAPVDSDAEVKRVTRDERGKLVAIDVEAK